MGNIFLDVETTSFHRTFRRPWELAFVADHDASVLYHVDDIDLTGADAESLNKSGYWKRYNKEPEAILLSENYIARTIQTVTKDQNLVGCATWFDAAIVEEMLIRHNLKPLWKKVVCVQALVSEKVGYRVQGLTKCADLLGVNYDDKLLHSALADTLLAREIYKKVIND